MSASPFIFISYRVDDSLTQAGRLHQSMELVFGKGSVFYDKKDIEPGDKWPRELEQKVQNAKVVLILINNEDAWLAVMKYGKRRIDNPEDWVYKEVKTALIPENSKLVIPVCINNTKVPPEDALPDGIKELPYCQYKQIRETNWDEDLRLLIEKIQSKITETSPSYPGENDTPKKGLDHWERFFSNHAFKHELGVLMTVDCDRTEHYYQGLCRDFLSHKNASKNLVFFITGCQHQRPISLPKRFVYELSSKPNNLNFAHFRDAAADTSVAVADLTIGFEYVNTWVDFWKSVQLKLFTVADDPKQLLEVDHCKGKDWVALTFRITEKQWGKGNVKDHIEFIVDRFSDLPEASRKFILFFVFEMQFAHGARLENCRSHWEKLDRLRDGINENRPSVYAAHHKLLPPVPKDDINNWFSDVVDDATKESHNKLLDLLCATLHPDDCHRTDFDMEKVEAMQLAAYQFIYRPTRHLPKKTSICR